MTLGSDTVVSCLNAREVVAWDSWSACQPALCLTYAGWSSCYGFASLALAVEYDDMMSLQASIRDLSMDIFRNKDRSGKKEGNG